MCNVMRTALKPIIIGMSCCPLCSRLMAGALTGMGLELIFIPWDAATLGRQERQCSKRMQDFYEYEPSKKPIAAFWVH